MSTTAERIRLALGPQYDIERELGAGGMATVFLARDLKHERRVAIKVLHPELSAVLGPERFLAEIKLTAALQHPGILPLFDSGAADGLLYYVMPYVEGETLRARLERERQLPVPDTLRIASEVADALQYAHERGVVHRDIKPENILLAGGRPLVADFGIALAVQQAGGARMTQTGMSLGTPQYMAPEQAMGEKTIDARADVYALGAVTYEMLAGEPPFTGPTVQAIIARILTDAPRSLSALRPSVPEALAEAVAAALEKLPADRLGSAREFAEAIDGRGGTATARVSGARRAGVTAGPWWRDWRTLALGAMTAGLAITLGWQLTRDGAVPPTAVRMSVLGRSDSIGLSHYSSVHGAPVFSPDGRLLAFVGSARDTTVLLVRDIESFALREIPGGGRVPTFSPDGRQLAFLRGPRVWKAKVDGSDLVLLGVISEPSWNVYELLWHPDGRLLVVAKSGLWALPSSGGELRQLIASDTATDERISNPGVLADGRIVINRRGRDSGHVEVMNPDGTARRVVPGVQPPVRYAGDVMVRVTRDQLLASRFDSRTLAPVGEAVAIANVRTNPLPALGHSIAWVHTDVPRPTEPVLVSRAGVETHLGLAPAPYRWPRLSPDARRLAILHGPMMPLEVIELATGARTLVSDAGGGTEPVWTSDSRSVVFSLFDGARKGLGMRPADASRGIDTLLNEAGGEAWPTDLSHDGSTLLFYGSGGDEYDLGIFDVRQRTARTLGMRGAQRAARFSPDGRLVAYQSDESGRFEIHVQPWPSLETRWVVSTDGGEEPVWAADGSELFYRRGASIMAVTIRPGPGFTYAAPRELFRGPYARDPWGDQSWDVARDGRFLLLRPTTAPPLEVRVIHGWLAETRARLGLTR